MRKLAVITVARSDFSIYYPLLKAIEAARDLELQLIVAGMHLDETFGYTKKEILDAGFVPAAELPISPPSDSALGVVQAMAQGCEAYGKCFDSLQPDIVVVLGDRFEMHPAALAALPFRIPVAHIHGGELTYGAFDDALRHSITKLSHLHFASTEEYAKRIVQMGENPEAVYHTGGLAIDNIRMNEQLSFDDFNAALSLTLKPGFVLTTFHPVTLESDNTEEYISNLLSAIENIDRDFLFTLPNADNSGTIIIDKIHEFVETHKNAYLVNNLGVKAYYSALVHAGAMLGNSSSGILEAAAFSLPVVNIGTRQAGRVRSKNVIDAAYGPEEIESALKKALSEDFKNSLNDLVNPYDNGGAAAQMVKVLSEVDLENIIIKKFHDQQK